MSSALFETYAKLIINFPDDCDQLFGQPLNSYNNKLWLSVDSDAYPSLLFETQGEVSYRNDIELRSLSARFSRYCNIETTDGAVVSGTYSVVQLNENDPDVVRMLCRFLEETFNENCYVYTNKEIADRVQSLANFFKSAETSRSDIVGLWGELYILSLSHNLTAAIKCWCQHRMSKYDYVAERFVLEVKTTVRSQRKHRFSLEQLRSQTGYQIYVASLILVELSSGKTVSELMESIAVDIHDNELRVSFLKQCLLKGGKDIYRNSLTWDVLPEGGSMIILDAFDIPVPEVKPDSAIENVRFDVDVSNLMPLDYKKVDSILAFDSDMA
ncbi:PD-(D/E)XK motif protein [Idiomarina sp. Sol25]|uniref:PD-(D/E)XK motif protein n=1 Tax=Idiomarina sp. Sol25 TaxID=3064000 RepID=UPI00294B6FFC|nr:PD-(D/E)XK motif protein [Idiomarina sp. Sol25]MDV6328555.1 PD-(D/E)XK motif protein [Idiomarina sp. Sol25]